MKKGQKVFVIRMDKDSCVFDAVTGRITQIEKDTIWVRIDEGKEEEIVLDFEPKEIYTSEREAVLNCAEMCREVAEKWATRSYELMKRAFKVKL